MQDAIERRGWCAWRKGDTRKTRFHGLDLGKGVATSMFYMPIRSTAFPDAAWLEQVRGQPLDVIAWLQGDLSRIIPDTEMIQPPKRPAAVPTPFDGMVKTSKVDEAISDYLGLGRGTQDYQLNRLAWRLAGYGLDEADIESHMHEAARGSHSKADREAQVARVMRHLRRKRIP